MMTDESEMLNLLEKELKACVQDGLSAEYAGLIEIINYQMGWEKETTKPDGKRVRPILLLKTVAALNGDWKNAVSAAAALELMHNYSLIHDDIEDKSSRRRGKDTVWVKWSEAQAINTGDAMLNLALKTPWRLEQEYSPKVTAKAVQILQKRSFELTQGQYLDISFEKRDQVSVEDYFSMIEGKTCSLLKAAFEMAGALADVDVVTSKRLEHCGSLLGRAYQIQDDWLGIWGDEALTGKSNQSDLVERKKTYPILLGLRSNGEFAAKWEKMQSPNAEEVRGWSQLLEKEGIKDKCEEEFERIFAETIETTKKITPDKRGASTLSDYISWLLKRNH
jgi:geranylgeranyl diphosphate synthase type I